MDTSPKIGIGYDAHRMVAGRPLVLGGVLVPFEKGLLGHSDADVLAHAVIDALLGAAGLGDIGRCFPDTDDQYKNISSLVLLEKTAALVAGAGFRVGNVDCVVVAQAPRLAPFLPEMAANMARCLGLPEDAVNVKAKTEEGMGFTGAGEGISAQAVCLLEQVGKAIFL